MAQIKGITIEIDANATPLQKALREVDATIRETQRDLREVDKLLKLDPGNTQLLAQKQKLLGDSIKETKTRLDDLKAAQKKVGEGTAEWNALQDEIVITEGKLESLTTQMKNFGSVSAQKLKVVGQDIKDVGDKIKGAGEALAPISAAAGAGLIASVKQAATFEAQMDKVQAISGASGEEMEILNQKAREMGASTKFSAQEADATCKSVNKSVLTAIDPLAVIKDNVAYTFGGALEREVEKYFFYIKNNPKEEARFAKQTAKREALLAKGKKVDWKIVPKSVIEPETQIETIVTVLTRVMDKFRADVESAEYFDADKRCIEIIDYLKEKASQVVYTLTKRIAKEKAIKLMEEVGIPEARMRYRQYPFEFSGGMRQRIVIAIALSANPDILICDEPTTALDVTIQAQILELINKLKKERNLSVIFITHDLGVVHYLADHIAVMRRGQIVEYGTADSVFHHPQAEYTQNLLAAIPRLSD